jgi:quercetin dioxygenase-like cupin family protein
MGIEKQPKPEWSPLPRPGCVNVEFRVLLGSDDLAIANLKFQQNATIDEHDADFDIDVLCIAGSGFTSIDDDDFPISEGETVRWPKGKMHCLWTIDTTMETIMVERHRG